MLPRKAFVAEVAADLEYLVHAAHEQALQIQLQRDAQVKITAERVVMRLERLGRRAAGDRLHHRRFHFHKSVRVQKAADLSDDLTALEKNVLHLRVRHQIEVTLAVADFRVFEPVPLGRRRAQRLGQDDKAGGFDGNFAGFGGEQRSFHPDKIGQVEMGKYVPLFITEDIFLGVNLDAAALVAHIDEHALAHVAVRGDAAGHGHFPAFSVILPRPGAGFGRRKFVPERVNAVLPQRGELGLALFNQ